MHLPCLLVEFKKEQIRIQLDNFGKLRISGERPLVDNQWSRFRKDYQVPEDCNVTEIQAKFENGRLSVILPKFITDAKVKDQPAQAQIPGENQKPTRPSVEPNGVPKKKEDEKRVEPTDTRKDAEKVGEEEKEQTIEKKGKEKVTTVVKHEEGEKGGEKDQTEEKKGKDKVAGDVKHEEVVKGGEKDQLEEKKGKEKVTIGDVKREEGEKGGAVTDVPGEVTAEREATRNGKNGLGKLMPKIGELGLGFNKQRQLMLNVIVAVVVLVAVGLYVTHKLRSPTEEDGHRAN